MKLNFGKRLVIFLHWMFSLLLFLLICAHIIVPSLIEEVAGAINAVLGVRLAEIVGIAILALYLLFAVLTVVILFSRKEKKGDRSFITVDSSESGKTRIAIGAVDQMIRQAVRGVEGIAEMKSSITNNDDSISVNLSVSVASGVHVPTVTMNVQRAIRSYIELNCGVAVREVSVSVNSLQPEDGGKGRRKGTIPAPAAPVYMPEAGSEAFKAPVPEAEKEETINVGPPEEPVILEEVREEAEAAEETVEIEPISLTIDPPADAVEEPETVEE